MSTDQEKFWQGEFGDSYISRNQSDGLLAANLSLFSDILQQTGSIESVLELGCNVGMNLMALELLSPELSICGVDINEKAIEELKQHKPNYELHTQSIIDPLEVNKFDLSFTKGVLIHINPDKLNDVYENLYNKSNKYICINEYYNPNPVTIN